MRHHQYNDKYSFVVDPVAFNKFTGKDTLQYCLGGTLYMPGTKKIIDKILEKKLLGLTSMVMCFEDAIQESDLPEAQKNVLEHLDILHQEIDKGTITWDDIPLIFVRVRNITQFSVFAKSLTPERASVLTGFVFPKFYSDNGYEYYRILSAINEKMSCTLYAMPILEGRELAFKESRIDELKKLLLIFRSFRDITLNVRVGGTDFSSIFGVRRGINYSVYDILPVKDCLTDILNFFNRSEDDFVISGPVWEYFLADKKESLEHLIEKDIHRSLMQRTPIVNEAIDGLLREVILDKANGFVGKTIIHPSHLRFVNAMQAVTKEEYDDSMQILNTNGGVVKAASANKMNEISPHTSWAKKIANRAKAFGVIANETEYAALFTPKK